MSTDSIILFVLVFLIFLVVLLPPSWDPMIRTKYKREFKERMSWSLDVWDYAWVAVAAIFAFLITLVVVTLG